MYHNKHHLASFSHMANSQRWGPHKSYPLVAYLGRRDPSIWGVPHFETDPYSTEHVFEALLERFCDFWLPGPRVAAGQQLVLLFFLIWPVGFCCFLSLLRFKRTTKIDPPLKKHTHTRRTGAHSSQWFFCARLSTKYWHLLSTAYP